MQSMFVLPSARRDGSVSGARRCMARESSTLDARVAPGALKADTMLTVF
jgi:hypothetical protein